MLLRKSVVGFMAAAIVSLPGVALASTSHSSAGSVAKLSPVIIQVQSGDTLWGLSSRYHVSLSKIESWNHLSDSSTLQIGAKVIIGWTSYRADGSKLSLAGRDSSLPSGVSATALEGEEVVAYAKQFLGVPYAWGGESASGFDCSGLVRFTYAHFGVSLDRSSYSQFQEGTSVSSGNLLPGDLVFFSSDGSGPSHVGIYIGGGEFVNAEERGVVVDSMYGGYWASCYYGARRVLS